MAQKKADDDFKVSKEIARVSDEIESVKKLLVLYLIKMGATSDEIGLALGVDSSAIRKMIPSREIKKFQFMLNTERQDKAAKK